MKSGGPSWRIARGWSEEHLYPKPASTGLVLGTERGNEPLVAQYHMFEGLVAPYRIGRYPLVRYSHGAPLFNLVYHDAVTNFGKIQDPNHLVNSRTGDYYVKSLRAMLQGNGPMLFTISAVTCGSE